MVAELVLRQLGIYIVIYFVFRKASKQLINKSSWLNYMLGPVFAVSMLFNIIFICFLEYQYIRLSDIDLSMEQRNIAL